MTAGLMGSGLGIAEANHQEGIRVGEIEPPLRVASVAKPGRRRMGERGKGLSTLKGLS
jgi:hypothetical protein